MTTEYRVKPLVRYIITRHEADEQGNAGTQHVGSEYSSGETAYEVAYALAKSEQERRGFAIGSMDLIFPQMPIQYRLEPHPVYGVDGLVFDSRAPSPY